MEKYKELLELNLFKFLTESHRLHSGEICDPKGEFAFKIDPCVKNLSRLRVLTENREIYEDYCQKLLFLYGVCPTLSRSREEKPYFCIRTKSGNSFSFGNLRYRADLSSLFIPEIEKLCQTKGLKPAFFAYCAILCKENSASKAVPEALILNENLIRTHSIF